MTRRLLWMILVATGLSGFVIGAVTSQEWWAWSWIGYPIVGGIVIWKQPANVIGRLLVGIGLGWGLTFVAEALIARSIASPGIELASEPLGYLPWLLMVDLTLVFPSGRATTTMTRWLRRAVVIVGGIVLVSLLVDPAPLELSGRPSPLGVEAARGITNFILQEQGFLIVPALLLLGLAGLFVRWRRSTGVERLQLQWFVSALVATILILASEGIIPSQLNFDFVAPVVLNLLPLAIGVAVLRYRLFEVDRVISRTVGFVLVAAIIAVVYGFGAVWLPTQIVGEQTPLFVAGSTLLVAALFNPLRRRVMKAVERRFHRGHYDAASVVDRFSQRLLNEVDVTHVTGDLMTLVSGTLRPTSVGLWLRKD